MTRQRLTPDRIVRTAIAMAEADGLDQVTMRGLARRLEVDAMSLYNHVPGRPALLDAITQQVLAGIELPVPTGNLGTDVRGAAHAFRAATLRHPNCAPLVLTRQLSSSAGLAPVDTVLGVLTRAGLSPERAVHAVRAILAYLVGTLLRETTSGPAFSGTDAGAAEQRLAELSGSPFPHVVASARHLATCDHAAEFDFGLDLLITALERQEGD
ncbi:Tetracycline repressor protein class G [Amycolatopsis sp. CA-230715]|nr:Tetracycline repressor protein class G [Amycolatopsis sp. CA-230715]